MKARIITSVVITAALALGTASLAFAEESGAQAIGPSKTAASLQASGSKMQLAKAKKGLVKKGSSYYYYKNGKMLKKAWKTVKGSKYYFQKNGKAAVGSVKIKGTYYIFKANGKLAKGKKTRVVTIKNVKYLVTKSGKAKSGWNASKTNYFDKNGKIVSGGTSKKIGSTTYCFDSKGSLIKGDGLRKLGKYDFEFLCSNSDGTYDAARTNLLNSYAIVDAECGGLIDLLGTPISTVTGNSCYSIGGEDSVPAVTRTYPNFKLITYKTSNGKEYFGYLDAK